MILPESKESHGFHRGIMSNDILVIYTIHIVEVLVLANHTPDKGICLGTGTTVD